MRYGFTLAVSRSFHMAFGVVVGAAVYAPIPFALLHGAGAFCCFVIVDFACGVASAAWEAFRDWRAER